MLINSNNDTLALHTYQDDREKNKFMTLGINQSLSPKTVMCGDCTSDLFEDKQ
jgi:hypothetical protein